MPTPSYRSGSHPKRSDLPPDQELIAEEVAALDDRLAELRAAFDRFFLGIDKRNPTQDSDSLKHKLWRLKQLFIRNTSLKFRIETLMAKFQAYERLWMRTLKEMEEGTYRRDLARLRRKNERAQQEVAARASAPTRAPRVEREAPTSDGAAQPGLLEFFEEELDKGLLDWEPPGAATLPADAKTPVVLPASSVRGAKPPPLREAAKSRAAAPAAPTPRGAVEPAAAPRPPVEASRTAGARPAPAPLPLPAAKLQQIFDAYVGAKRRCRESTEGITLEAVATTVRQQLQALRGPGVKQVDFKVVIKDGRALLKVVPK